MNKENQMEIIRHGLSHVMAAAVKEFYPDVKFAIGPAIENGFYYDFDFNEIKIKEEDFEKIEKKMREIIKKKEKFERSEIDIDEAIKKEKKEGQIYKQELIEDLKKEGEKKVSYYKLDNFSDLCKGPHVDSSEKINPESFKLTKIAGAYWRGSEKNKMLTRIYGVAFEDKIKLDEYLKMIEEAEKRDHRKIGKELDLFSFHDAAPGMPFFHPKGMAVYNELKGLWTESQKDFGYDFVQAPSMLDSSMWKRSGHWDHYREDMYFINAGEEGREYALRPMDCPGAILIYNNSPKSYRDLPIRLAEPGLITRKEKSGQLNGLFRVQQFVQDDAHIFISEEQIESEIKNVISLIDEMYKPFGMEFKAYLSTRPDDFMGEIGDWNKAEESLKKILQEVYGESYGVKEKDGAFYGPKIDYQLKDVLGRTWQCATIQLDFQMPQKFNCKYIAQDGKEKTPVLIHRTIFGSFERFMGIIIEHFGGSFPVWLSPVQIKIISISEKHVDYCRALSKELKENGFRVEIDDNNETVGNKIRKSIGEKIPYLLVVGDKEMESGKLNIRDRGEQKTREVEKEEFIKEVHEKIKTKK